MKTPDCLPRHIHMCKHTINMFTCIGPHTYTCANKILEKNHYFQESTYYLNQVPCFSFFFSIKQPTWEKQQQKTSRLKPPHLWWHCRGISKQPHKSQPRGALRAVSKAFLGEAGMQMIPLVALYIWEGSSGFREWHLHPEMTEKTARFRNTQSGPEPEVVTNSVTGQNWSLLISQWKLL